jgi:methylthioribose-1-phosphate isomerase
VWNPAFDVTPNNLIDLFITDRGVVRPPFAGALAQMMKS